MYTSYNHVLLVILLNSNTNSFTAHDNGSNKAGTLTQRVAALVQNPDPILTGPTPPTTSARSTARVLYLRDAARYTVRQDLQADKYNL